MEKMETTQPLDDRILRALVELNLTKNFYEYAKRRKTPARALLERGREDGNLYGALIVEWRGSDYAGLERFLGLAKNADDSERRVFTGNIEWHKTGDVAGYIAKNKHADRGFVVYDSECSSFVRFDATRSTLRKLGLSSVDEVHERYLPENFEPSETNIGTRTEAALFVALSAPVKSYILKKTVSGNCGVGKVARFGENGLEVEVLLESVPELDDEHNFGLYAFRSEAIVRNGRNGFGNVACIARTYRFDDAQGKIVLADTKQIKPAEIYPRVANFPKTAEYAASQTPLASPAPSHS